MTKVRLSFGSDPEFMLTDHDGNFFSAIGIINSTKEKKINLGNGHKIFYDNVLCELNIKPSYSEAELISNLLDCFHKTARLIFPYRLKCQASNIYPESECRHPDSKVFGCEPEYCAYDMAQITPPVCEPGNTFRCAGGHIHLGYTGERYPLNAAYTNNDRNDRDWGKVWVVRMLDLFVGIPSIILDQDPTSAARRRLYGKAGTHRPKEEYGIEYRAISNFWLQNPRLTSLIYKLSAFSVDFVASGTHKELWKNERECNEYDVANLRKVIDNSDIDGAKHLIQTIVKKYLPSNLYTEIFTATEIAKSTNFYREWNISI